MPDELVAIIKTLPGRLRETLKCVKHANRNYRQPEDADIARELKVSIRTVRRRRAALNRLLPNKVLLRARGRHWSKAEAA